MTKKISSTQIDKNDVLFLLPGDKALKDADLTYVRVIDGSVTDEFKNQYGYSTAFGDGGGGGGEVVVPPVTPGIPSDIANLIPQLGDISIKSQTINYNTNPPTVTVVLKVKNSTGKTIVGMRGKKPA